MKILSLINIFLLFISVAFNSEAATKASPNKQFTLVVDAGHGGKDIGATDNKAREKDINLGVALELEKLVKSKLKDSKIVMTRDKDVYLTLQERADVANKAKGDLFISIHTNSVDKSSKNRKTVAGSSVYALGLHKNDNNMAVARRENAVIELENNFEQKYSGFDPSKDESYIIFEMAQKKNLASSIKFAELAQKNLVNAGRVNRGVHQAGFWVLWATSMPAVLVELDFICNPQSADYLTSEKGQKELAEAIFKAVESYYKDWQKSQGNANMTKSIAAAAKTASDEHLAEQEEAKEGKESSKVRLSSKSNVKREDKAPATNTSSRYAGARRRRSDAAREASSTRSVETSEIPLHSSKDRVGETVKTTAKTTPGKVKDEAKASDSKSKDKGKKEKEKKDKKTKNKEKEVKNERPANSHNAKVEKFVTVYKIQILASSELLKQNNPRFQGLRPITTYKENNLYKYYFGETTDETEINQLLEDVKKKIPDAFVVTSKKMKTTTNK